MLVIARGATVDSSDCDDDLADVLVGLDETMRRNDVIESERACDRRPKCSTRQTLTHKTLQRRQPLIVAGEHGQRDASDGEVACEHIKRRYYGESWIQRTVENQRCARGGRLSKRFEARSAGLIEH